MTAIRSATPITATPVIAPLASPGPLADSQTCVPVSATLAVNDALAARERAGQPVLPLGFGEAGVPVHPLLIAELGAAAGNGGYGPVAGSPELRSAAAGYWTRRGLPTGADAVVAGPGSKALLFALLLGIGCDIAVPRPSWVSYAAQARLTGLRPHFVPAAAGLGGICDPDALARTVQDCRAAGHALRAVIVTLPDNPTGTLATPDAVRELCEVAARYDLIIISDEIYRDLVHDETTPFLSPAQVAPERTVVTTALSKSLALGGWRLGVARLPANDLGAALRDRMLGVGSEIWSAPAAPIQHAAAVAFSEPPEIRERIAQSRALHAAVARGVAGVCADAGITVPAPQASFYVYPDFEPWRGWLRSRGIGTGPDLARHLITQYGLGALPASAFGEDEDVLRLRLATAMIYGDTSAQREAALTAADPLRLPPIASALDRLAEVLADLGP
ncbi:MAG TPA: pyridoxal phosphate-dependent aminotransferase [Streptosporangiaceae bacterium]|nr:pyridoxal phosphate-dependent aminotransferase [Streptosporangiaceae bacterium]